MSDDYWSGIVAGTWIVMGLWYLHDFLVERQIWIWKK